MDVQQPEATLQTEKSTTEPVETQEKVRNPDAVLSKNRELLGQNKNLQSELAELRDWRKSQEQAEQERKGNHQQVIDALRDEIKLVKEEKEKDRKNFTFSKFEDQFKASALQAGCVNPDKLLRLTTKEQVQAVDVNENFKINPEDLGRLMVKLKEDHSDIGLFSKKTANVTNVNGGFKAKSEKKLEELTREEIKERLKRV